MPNQPYGFTALIVVALLLVSATSSAAHQTCSGTYFFSSFNGNDYYGGLPMRVVPFSLGSTSQDISSLATSAITNRGLSYDPVYQQLYWGYYDYNGPPPGIYRTDLDGSNLITIDVGDYSPINSVFVDTKANLLCFGTNSAGYCTAFDPTNSDNLGVNSANIYQIAIAGASLDCSSFWPQCYGYYVTGSIMWRIEVKPNNGSVIGSPQQVVANTIESLYEVVASDKYLTYNEGTTMYLVNLTQTLPATPVVIGTCGQFPALTTVLGCPGLIMYASPSGILAYDATSKTTLSVYTLVSDLPLAAAASTTSDAHTLAIPRTALLLLCIFALGSLLLS